MKMGTLSMLPLSFSCALTPRKPYLSNSILWSRASLYSLKMAKMGTKSVVFGANSSDPKESMFMNENGAINDMDGYLNYLSLEYDSVWDTKPSWCQPWTITLTGVLAIAGSWLILHSFLFTMVIILLVCGWWYIFLYSYPKAYVDMIAERRKRVMNGVEDTFGVKKR
ncbi:uncharacterized protein LOC123222919 [Mangifera indica]|uniref:uncharacterized protein LOC123222919 n=1 Tax=Mangifera indica TaxID=29780 RepID=UPI001CF9E4E2|nr:uncharacterized protein LOC123222919 [Mangifera indica]